MWQSLEILNVFQYFNLTRLSVKAGMGNRGTEWGEWWKRVESGWDAGNQGENAGNQGGNAGIGVGNAGNAGIQVGNAGNQANSLWESSCLLLRLNSRSTKGAFHHPDFMGSCPTTSHTFFVLSTKWMSELLCIRSYWSRWCVGVSQAWPKVHAASKGVCYFG